MEKQLRVNEAAEGLETDVGQGNSGARRQEQRVQADALPLRTRNVKPMTRQVLGKCERCGYMSSQAICHACTLLESLNKNRPQVQL